MTQAQAIQAHGALLEIWCEGRMLKGFGDETQTEHA